MDLCRRDRRHVRVQIQVIRRGSVVSIHGDLLCHVVKDHVRIQQEPFVRFDMVHVLMLKSRPVARLA